MACKNCGSEKILIKSRQLCSSCYQKLRKKTGPLKETPEFEYKTPENSYKKSVNNEMEFAKNYFDHKNWIYKPVFFRVGNETYQPDFYDAERNVFIEVSATRQAYHKNKNKYKKFREIYPKIILEIRITTGELLEDQPINNLWRHQYSRDEQALSN